MDAVHKTRQAKSMYYQPGKLSNSLRVVKVQCAAHLLLQLHVLQCPNWTCHALEYIDFGALGKFVMFFVSSETQRCVEATVISVNGKVFYFV